MAMEASLKERIFGSDEMLDLQAHQEPALIEEEFCLEEILEALVRVEKKAFIFCPNESEKIDFADALKDIRISVEENESREKPPLLLYQLSEDTYYVYARKREERERDSNYNPQRHDAQEKDYGLFIPTGVVVRRVPQNILGNGVLGRAFIHQDYIEVLDSLMGNEYMEVLTHEVFHIMYPEKREAEVRQMTRNCCGNAVYN